MQQSSQVAQGLTGTEVAQLVAVLVFLAVSYFWLFWGQFWWERRQFLRKVKGKSFDLDVTEP
jgi:hypothetical protein